MEYKRTEVKSELKYVLLLFDLDPMTLILKPYLDMVKIYLYFENEIPSYSSSKVRAKTDRHTGRQTDPTEIITHPHKRMVNSHKILSPPLKKDKNLNRCMKLNRSRDV